MNAAAVRPPTSNPTSSEKPLTSRLIPRPISGVVHRYDWGKIGESSLVGRLSGLGQHEPTSTFAELWFGAHPSAPSPVKAGEKSETLLSLLLDNPAETLGSSLQISKDHALPFMMKVLSVHHPLSIQLHPNADDAVSLHAQHPDHYPDPNPKPELSVALSDVELLCGYSPAESTNQLVNSSAELAHMRDSANCHAPHSSVALAQAIILSTPTIRAAIANRLIQSGPPSGFDARAWGWFLRLHGDFGGEDPGVLLSLVLHYMVLAPGESVFIAPGVPHAYLSGDMVECMASSDNVVRVGLTQKFKDVPTFLDLLGRAGVPSEHRLIPTTQLLGNGSQPLQGFSYQPPVAGFTLTKIVGPCGGVLPRGKPAILLCTSGEGTLNAEGNDFSSKLGAGDAFFIPARSLHITLKSTTEATFFFACSG